MNVQRLSTWAALRCREPAFQAFLGVDDEAEAAEKVRQLCGVQSRSELDRDPEAAQRLHEIIRHPYIQFCEENT